jgi:hypothetical protein
MAVTRFELVAVVVTPFELLVVLFDHAIRQRLGERQYTSEAIH